MIKAINRPCSQFVQKIDIHVIIGVKMRAENILQVKLPILFL